MRLLPIKALCGLLLATGILLADEPAELEKLRADRTRLIDLVLKLEADFSTTIKEYGALQTDYAKLLQKPQAPDQRGEVAGLRKELSEAARKIRQMKRLEDRNEASTKEIARLKETLTTDLANLRKELVRERQTLAYTRNQLDELRTIQIETRKVEDMLRLETIKRADLQDSLQTLRGERDALVLRLEENMSRLAESDAARKKAEGRVAELEKASATLRETIAANETEITALRKKASETDRHRMTIARLEGDKKTLSADLDRHRMEIATLKKDLAGKQDLKKSFDQLSLDMAASNKRLAQQDSAVKKLTADLVTSTKLNSEITTLRTKEKEALTKQLALQEKEDQAFRAETAKRLAEMSNKAQAEVAKLQKKQEELAREATLKVAALEKDKTKLQNELAKRETELAKAKANAVDPVKMNAAVAELEKEKAALADQVAKREADLKDTRRELGKLQLKTEATEKQLHALKVRFARIEPVRYALGAADVKDQQERVLRDVKEVLAMFPSARFEIVGHTCDLGSQESNLKLSRERAASLLSYLGENGISPELLKARGIADAEPLVPNTNEANRRRNRRVEIHILD
ncbi:MAG: OmpA family protein [Verrucomicrobiaceae bacterium]